MHGCPRNAYFAGNHIKTTLKLNGLRRERKQVIARSYPMAFCTQGFSPGTRARRTAAFTSHALLLRKRMRR